MKLNLTGDQWLDPATFRVAFQFNNHNGSNGDGFQITVQPLSWNPAVFFRRARLICGGQVVEDIDDFNRLSLMLTDLLLDDDRHDIGCEGFGGFDFVKGAAAQAAGLPDDDQHDIGCEGLGGFDFVKGAAAQAAGQRKGCRQTGYDISGNVGLARRVMFKPMLGLFNQGN